jgi:hypothetical protein
MVEISRVVHGVALPKSADEHAERVRVRGRGLFLSRETRDAVAAKLRSLGCVCIVGSAKHPRAHPTYITDFVGEWDKSAASFKTRWDRLYTVQLV